MDAAMNEAMAATTITDPQTPEEREKMIEEALSCPCVADVKEGPCGEAFVGSFACFIRSEETDKGSDCIEHFKMLQECMMKNPDAFQEFFTERAEKEGGESKPEEKEGGAKAEESG
mmetsp:Transcript_14155/g.30257  ORF Transcript_14155/g.30257 Transcript_14155/m.30257 type:complete len:116 (-) Transcript_14155:366-713(-)|eukprot:CAMPEP_0118938638 /NCGR_PEP_ID=MMETSP1169-20130426/26598_1 /TAXON_ID=36882 /ORGANISM="Pyramimonas obovata, Strain CCMP722" /LENGTH=115 /DNA_ID=CAMNT_0006882641 /DNA_START=130 /DNA_END=477 /DNA_ORIENTATION=+